MSRKTKLIFIGIFIFAGLLRLYGINWDQGYHMHPDERAIILFTNQLFFPDTLAEFFSVKSGWNPHFFAYGSFPLYLLFWVGTFASLLRTEYFSYDYLTIIGRSISLLVDLGILSLVFFIGRKLWNEKTALLATLFYGLSTLPIQLSRFYTVDTLLSFFILLTLYLLIRFYERPSIKLSILTGISLALSFATKISATVLILSFLSTILLDFILLFIKAPHRPRKWLQHVPMYFKRLILYFAVTGAVTIILFIFLQPYVLIDFQEFWQQTLSQAAMTKSAFTFPYTLQYVGKIPYLYDLKQIFFVGLGPVLATVCFLGIIKRGLDLLRKKADTFTRQELILIIFFISYFLVVGKFAIGFIRYMLPLYPILCLFGALFCYQIFMQLKRSKILLTSLFFILLLIWPLSFMTIYTRPFTRFQASAWIVENIPEKSTLAIEHWDDSLPLFNAGSYLYKTLALYEPESPSKWETIHTSINSSDYIILASNRLYTPLSKLTNCNSLPIGKCYRQTAKYYEDLFAGRLGYKKVAEFSSFATIPFTNIQFNDQGMDESFSVYDHPVVIIFKNMNKN